MKKIISMALALIMAASVFCACASEGATKEEQTTQETEKLPSYSGQTPADYDAEGNFILTSSENRKVYSYDSGYIVFSFTGEAVSKVLRVLEFEDETAAEEYLTSTARAQVEKGEVPDTMRRSGVYVVINVPYDPEDTVLAPYYNKTKSDIIGEFETEEAEG